MLKIKHHSIYTHFPQLIPQNGERYIDMYDTTAEDFFSGYKGPRAVALMLEPRSLAEEQYRYLDERPDQYKLILTHDSKTLTLPNARFFNWADVWYRSDATKTKGISLVSSWKDWCPLHKARLELARRFDEGGLVDCFGSFRDPEHWDDVRLAHEAYRYAIVIENEIDELWYTEKLVNCFANKVVPIYVGATRIGEIFNADGIIQVSDWHRIPDIVRDLDIEEDYKRRKEAIEDNFERSKAYDICWKDRIIRDFGETFTEIQNA